jgi:CcmD family protein
MDTPPDTYPSLFFGYAVIWGLIVLFCLTLGFRQRDIAKRLSELKKEEKNG